ncbi:MAG: nucleoside deaminase [Arenicellales bacterium]|nr:nucleoside deaminase [Arenicellales bacterium]
MINTVNTNPGTTPTERDILFLEQAYQEALAGYNEGGVPVGAVMVKDGKIVARGRNKRIQEDDAVMHGETDCLRAAGLRNDYGEIDLYTTLSPCMMCTGAILHFGIKRVVVGEDTNFPGNIVFLREHGVEVILVDDPECKKLMSKFIAERADIWFEDIAGNETV